MSESSSQSLATWGYVRLSKTGRDNSLDEQKRAVRDYARSVDRLSLKTTLNEGDQTSGFNSDRELYQRLLTNIQNGNIEAVIVRDRARLSRDFDDRLSLLTLFRETGCEWHVIEAGGHVDVTDTYTAAMECVHAGMDHAKKMAEIERSKAATRERIERGCYQGAPPFGLTFHSDGCHLEKDEDRWPVCEELFDAEFPVIQGEKLGVHESTAYKVNERGREWYEQKLEEYGINNEVR